MMRFIYCLFALAAGVASGSTLSAQDKLPDSLVTGAQVTASSEESNSNNFARHAIDGLLDTRWCASSGKPGEWIQIDFGQPQNLKSLRLHWEGEKTGYRYLVESSPDGTTWKPILDRSKENVVESRQTLAVDAPETRYLKITYLGSSTGGWGSLREIEASEQKLPELPKHPPASLNDVVAPPEFNVTLFGIPPTVNYPVCLTAATTGEVFVGVDEQGSVGKDPDGGKILRCLDTDGDGLAGDVGRRPSPGPAGAGGAARQPECRCRHDGERGDPSPRSAVLSTFHPRAPLLDARSGMPRKGIRKAFRKLSFRPEDCQVDLHHARPTVRFARP